MSLSRFETKSKNTPPKTVLLFDWTVVLYTSSVRTAIAQFSFALLLYYIVCLRRVVFASWASTTGDERDLWELREIRPTGTILFDIFRTVALPYTSPSWDSRAARFTIYYTAALPLLFPLFAPCCCVGFYNYCNCWWCERDVSCENKKHSSPTKKKWFRLLRGFFGSESRL